MIVEPAGTRFYYPSRKEVILKCNIQDMSFLFSQLYNMILITICTVYAVKTRKIPENFNESKFIGFTMYTTCIIWLAFIPIYFGTGNSYEVRSLISFEFFIFILFLSLNFKKEIESEVSRSFCSLYIAFKSKMLT